MKTNQLYKILGSSVLGAALLLTTTNISGTAQAKVATHTLGDKVWHDLDRDGLQDSNEPGISGIKVTLTSKEDSEFNQETVTDENGNYKFEVNNGGNYVIHFELPNGYTETATGAGGDGMKSQNDSKGNDIEVGISENNRPYDLNNDLGLVNIEE